MAGIKVIAKQPEMVRKMVQARRRLEKATAATLKARQEAGQAIIEARAQGWSEYDIAKVLNVSRTTVRAWQKELTSE